MALAGKVSQLSAALGGATDSLSRRVCTPMSPFALMIRSLYTYFLFYTVTVRTRTASRRELRYLAPYICIFCEPN